MREIVEQKSWHQSSEDSSADCGCYNWDSDCSGTSRCKDGDFGIGVGGNFNTNL